MTEHTKNRRREYTREYKERQRRANGTKPRAGKLITPYFRGDRLQTYLNRLITLQPKPVLNETNYGAGTSQMESYLNGIRLEPNDSRYIRRLGTKRYERTDLRKVDALAIKYDLPLWEMQDAAGCYKRDKRNTSKYHQSQ